MSFIIDKSITSSELTVKCLIPNEFYKPYKERLENQILSSIEVPGFRKGKAPKEIAFQKINILTFYNQVYNEIIDKFFPDVSKEIEEYLEEKDRIKDFFNADIKQETINEDDKGFSFEVGLKLLPQIIFDDFKKLKITKAKEEEIPNLLKFEDVLEREIKYYLLNYNEYISDNNSTVKENYKIKADLFFTDLEGKNPETRENKDIELVIGDKKIDKNIIGMKVGETKTFIETVSVPHDDHYHDKKVEYKVVCKEILKPKYSKIEDIIKNNSELEKQIKSKKELEKTVKTKFDNSIQLELQKLDDKKLIQALITDFKVTDLPIKFIDSEVDRIFSNLTKTSTENKLDIVEVFKQTKLPNLKNEKLTKENIPLIVRDYVESEIKLVSILKNCYQKKVEKKVTEEEIETLAKSIKSYPESYGYSKNDVANLEDVKNIAFDKMIRELAFDWIKSQVQFID